MIRISWRALCRERDSFLFFVGIRMVNVEGEGSCVELTWYEVMVVLLFVGVFVEVV